MSGDVAMRAPVVVNNGEPILEALELESRHRVSV